MKLRTQLFSLFNVIVINALLAAAPPAYKTTPNGVIIYTDPFVTGTSHAVKPEKITDNIIRVMAAPEKEITPMKQQKTLQSATVKALLTECFRKDCSVSM